jgi:hypothetical protein
MARRTAPAWLRIASQIIAADRDASPTTSAVRRSLRRRAVVTAPAVRRSSSCSNSPIGRMIVSLSAWYFSSCMIRRAMSRSGSPRVV